MKRRHFIQSAVVGAMGASSVSAIAETEESQAMSSNKGRFKLKYAPHFGMFRQSAGKDLVDQLKFAADEGFTAWEDNNLKRRPVAEQERLAKAMEDLGIEMGVFVCHGNFGKITFAGNNKADRKVVLKDIRESIDVAKRINAKWMTIVLDAFNNRLEPGFQMAYCIDLLRECAEILEPHNLVMVMEPLNWWTNHAGLFLAKIPQAYELCRAVNSPSCKILFDIYHQQIQEGNLAPNLDRAWDEVGYIQVGDNPGRKEPGTGEINYRFLFEHLHKKGYQGIIGMEHGNSKPGKEGERAVIDAYVAADDF